MSLTPDVIHSQLGAWFWDVDTEEIDVPLEYEAADEIHVGSIIQTKRGWYGEVIAIQNGGYSVEMLAISGKKWVRPTYPIRRWVWESEVA